MYVRMYVFICLRMANISNWNKALWTPDIIYYNFSVDWNVLFKFHYSCVKRKNQLDATYFII